MESVDATSNEQLRPIWDYFVRLENNSARCKDENCNKIIKTPSSGTTGLHIHLKSHHRKLAQKRSHSGKKRTPEENTTTIAPFSHRSDNLKLIVSRMTACDGLPFLSFATSTDLRACIAARLRELGLKDSIPLSEKTIQQMVLQQSTEAKQETKEVLLDIRKRGSFLSLDLDEWSSKKNRRYINVNVFDESDNVWNLGMIRLTQRGDADRILELVEERLAEYDLGIKTNIVGVTTDGCSVMTRFGRLSGVLQQLCLAHGIQLAVVDSLYTPKISDESRDDADFYSVELDCDKEDDLRSDGFDIEQDEIQVDLQDEFISNAIKKVRQLGVLFKRSPTSNEILQGYVKLKEGTELNLMLDCKTRWSSLFKMIERYIRIQDCVDKALIDIKSQLVVTQEEKCALSHLVDVLSPIACTVNILCERSSNLIKAKAVLMLLLEELESQKNELAKKVLMHLKLRIKERWGNFAGVLQYLHYGFDAYKKHCENCTSRRDDELSINEVIDMPRRVEVKHFLVNLISRMNGITQNNEESGSNSITETVEFRTIGNVSYLEKLNLAVKETELKTQQSVPAQGLASVILQEMTTFEMTGFRGPHLARCYNMLLTIKPTSVESERSFSAASYLCPKIRSRLSDSSLDCLCFLRAYFKNKYFFPNAIGAKIRKCY